MCVCVCVCVLVAQSCPLFLTPQIVACQASLSMEFSRQEHWSGLPFSSPEDLPDPGIQPRCPASQADSLPFELQGSSNSQEHLVIKEGDGSIEELEKILRQVTVGCSQRAWG